MVLTYDCVIFTYQSTIKRDALQIRFNGYFMLLPLDYHRLQSTASSLRNTVTLMETRWDSRIYEGSILKLRFSVHCLPYEADIGNMFLSGIGFCTYLYICLYCMCYVLYLFSLPLNVGRWLRIVFVALPGLLTVL